KHMAPQILGILNITEDSFSDGGQFLAGDAALEHGRHLIRGGADIIDVGPSASNPDAKIVPPEEEIRRLQSVMPALLADGARISVDSFQSETLLWAIENGAHYLNDIHGFADPSIYDKLAASSAMLIAMHAIQNEGVATREKGDAER